MKLLVLSLLVAVAAGQHLSHYGDHGGHEYLDKSHAIRKHGRHAASEEYGDEAVDKHALFEVAGHKEHGAKAAHHGEVVKHHDKGIFERNKGHGYEKSYAYDHVKSSHDKGSSHDAYGFEQAHHGLKSGHKISDDSSHGHAKHAKKSSHGTHSYADDSKLKSGHAGYHRSHEHRPAPVVSHYSYAPAPAVIHHAAPVAHHAAPLVHHAAPVAHHSAPVVHHAAPASHYAAPVLYAGPEHHGYLH